MTNLSKTAQKVHRDNLVKSWEHRLATANDTGNILLIKQLEAEKRYYGQ